MYMKALLPILPRHGVRREKKQGSGPFFGEFNSSPSTINSPYTYIAEREQGDF